MIVTHLTFLDKNISVKSQEDEQVASKYLRELKSGWNSIKEDTTQLMMDSKNAASPLKSSEWEGNIISVTATSDKNKMANTMDCEFSIKVKGIRKINNGKNFSIVIGFRPDHSTVHSIVWGRAD